MKDQPCFTGHHPPREDLWDKLDRIRLAQEDVILEDLDLGQTCCFTGHRHIPRLVRVPLIELLDGVIVNLIHQGVRYFGAGGALGFDTMAAFSVLRLKPRYPHIRLILVLPCKDQADAWSEEDKKRYNLILHYADKVVYISEQYSPGCMHRRNRHLVDHSGICVCYLTEPKSGTAYTVNCARQNGLRVINLAAANAKPKDFSKKV